MHVFLIHGQSHKGTTCHMGRMLAEKLAEDTSITEFFLPRDLPHFCLGCYACVEDETKCPFWKEKERILSAMEKADLLIFTTPNYCLSPSGAMKSFIDLFFDLWMVHRPKEWMFSKKAVILSASAGASCKKAIAPIKSSLFNWGVPEIHTFGCAVQASSWDGVKPKKKAKMEKRICAIARKLEKGKAPHVGIPTRFVFSAMGMMHKKGWDSFPVEKAYWEQQGWLGKGRPWKE